MLVVCSVRCFGPAFEAAKGFERCNRSHPREGKISPFMFCTAYFSVPCVSLQNGQKNLQVVSSVEMAVSLSSLILYLSIF